MSKQPKIGERGYVFGYAGTVLTSGKLISFEADCYKDSTRPVMVVPSGLFKKSEEINDDES